MTHPEDLLADYVDGTLSSDQRAVVDAHLEGCASCREEVELARGAVAALAILPEEPVPFGVTGPVLAEAGRSYERRRLRWGRLQYGLGAAAAAALILVVVLNVGGTDRQERAALESATAAGEGGAQAPAPAATPGAPGSLGFAYQGLEDQGNVDYDEAGIHALAEDAVPIVTGQEATLSAGDSSAAARSDRDAVDCIKQSGAPTVNDPRDTLLRLIAAEYAGTPAYIAVYAEGPGANQPPDRVVVWAVDQETCGILTTASLRI